MNSREREVKVKQEGNPNYTKITPSSRSQWSSHKNPRIVRVSRSFGGKDRHSKVCTVRGLRDRRIRLSVPTAIQLYDLQDKLGLSQPSKVVDWLLDATKDDIDKLPPLPTIPGIFTQFYNPNESAAAASSSSNPQSSLSQFLASNPPFAKNLGISSPSKQGMKMDEERVEKEKWIEQENPEGFGGFAAQLSAQNLFPLGNIVNHHHHHQHQSHFPNLTNFNPYFHWDHPNLSLSHFGGAYPLPNQAEDQPHNALSAVVPSTSHLYFCPTATPTTIPPFPPYLPPSMENVQQNLGFSTALHLMSSPMRPFALNMNSKSLHPQQNDAGRLEKEE